MLTGQSQELSSIENVAIPHVRNARGAKQILTIVFVHQEIDELTQSVERFT